MLDNVADLLLAVGLLVQVFGFPTNFALEHMVPGTAIGVLVGDLAFFVMALLLVRRTGRNDITAMPLGLDTPSTLGMVFFVLGPAFLYAQNELNLGTEAAARYTWHIGICSIVISGVFKTACAFVSGWVRRVVPRAGLLGSLAAIALVLISFMPLMEILSHPVAGFTALAVILTTLVARVRLPFRIPGAFGALLVGAVIYYLMQATGTLHNVSTAAPFAAGEALLPTGWFEVFTFQWTAALSDSVRYLPVVIPFALATVVGGIDCTESAAAAGDDFPTGQVILVEAIATLIAGLCGGVIQSTPYIGHPAYKAMGGRSAYTLATALFVGAAGLLAFFGFLYVLIPKATVFPILVFVGLEITAQSFHATPRRHYPAVAMACIPALAALAFIFADKLIHDPAVMAAGVTVEALGAELQNELRILKMLNNGFIITSLIWASALAAIVDRKLRVAAIYFVIAGGCALFGIIHSPLDGGKMFVPWQLDWEFLDPALRYVVAYFAVAAMLTAWGYWRQAVENDDSEPALDSQLGDKPRSASDGDSPDGDSPDGDSGYGDSGYGDSGYGDSGYGDSGYGDSADGNSTDGDSPDGAATDEADDHVA